MAAGTIALTNGSTSVAGTGTSFTSELKVGDFVYVTVGGAPYTLVVASVSSDTQIVLAVAFDGPTTSGLAWNSVPASLQVAITQKILNDFASVARGRILDFQNWQKIYSDAQSVTVTRPDRTTFTGPSWGYMANQYASKIDKSQNLSDLADKSAAWKALFDGRTSAIARTDLGLKGLALQDQIDRSDLNAELLRYTFSTGGRTANIQGAGVWGWDNTPFGYGETYGTCLQVSNRSDGSGAAGNGVWQHYLGMGTGGNLIYASNINGQYRASKVYTTFNTTTNSTGALVPASPIVRIVNDRDTVTRLDLLGVSNEEYSWVTKRALCNEESKGCTVSRTDTGTYLIKGAIGLAKDLWSVMDCGNGQGRIIALAEAEEMAEGVVVRCYKQKYTLTDDGDLTVGKGALIDIPNETWIDVRLEMPADSAYNQRQQEVAAQMNEQSSEDAAS
ncbi:hypothetical protein RM155_08285 [Pantoea agglomerans]|uniref:phage tail fiber protein n=1 Tax=Enterobacter agglomerans TaxID=549 RepID=UPI0028A26FCC|nr:hypothetical protein [Pantoea agglomerans]WNK72989.1 hypothetical protein RM155_08285 [Pantoea agglomerans]